MVAFLKPPADPPSAPATVLGFRFLKPIQKPPAPKKRSRLSRWLNGAIAGATVGALCLGGWLSSRPMPDSMLEASALPEIEISDDSGLLTRLASPEFKDFQEQQEKEKIRIDIVRQAESEASQLLATAEADAEQSARELRLEALYAGADGVMPVSEGDIISLDYDAVIRCGEHEFGKTATITPSGTKGARRIIKPLASCNDGRVASGEPVGVANEYPVAEVILN